MSIIDVSSDCGHKAVALRAAGIATVIRYYSRDTIRPSKRLSTQEAAQLAAAGLRIGIVHEGRRGDKPDNFDRACGIADAQYAWHYATQVIGQPSGSTIYFGVDFDATAAQIRTNVIPYFQGVADGLTALRAAGAFAIGVYGSGRTCRAVLDAGLATHAWLAQSTGWGEYKEFLASGRWALKQGMATNIAGIECDPNEAGHGQDIGDFALPGSAAGAALPAVPAPVPPVRTRLFVNARHGLRVRSGPGTAFEARPPSLPYGTGVFPLRAQDGWTLVDLQGDGKADGFVSSGFLTDQLAPDPPPPSLAAVPVPPRTPDAIDVPELIRQGRSAEGLKRARETARAALPGYPTNGCAAHLSALLQQAAIAVPMTWGAGKLAHLLAERNWRRIACGDQMAGDVGVCFDNDPTPAGADHIYLVVEVKDRDLMLIADNQRKTDAPHERFASGHGKTPTEYFLRAG